jgi:hypothetical protein
MQRPGGARRFLGLRGGLVGRLGLSILSAFALIAVCTSAAAVWGARLPAATSILSAQQSCTDVYASPDTHSSLLTQLPGGADVTSLGQTSAGGVSWQHVHFWSGLDGYIHAGDLGSAPPADAVEGSCAFPGVPDPQSDLLPENHGPWPFAAQGTLSAPATLYAHPDRGSLPIAGVGFGAPISIVSWASDTGGQPWYQVTTSTGPGWLWSGDVRLAEPNPVNRVVAGKPIWAPVAGKGMWFTNFLPHHSNISAIVQAAKLAGITHLYAEVAITQYGFYGRNTLDRLLSVAHAAGVSVVAAVYPDLHDVSADVRLTAEVAAYVTPTGDRADGIVTDVEEVDDSASVYTYGQLVRGLLGPDTLLVADVFHPYAQVYYPYAAIAASWNVISPMDYWHSSRHFAYSTDNVRFFVANSLQTIRAAMSAEGAGAALPVEELGQTYDMFTGDGTGASTAPTAAEVTADLRAARDLGCIGASFFEWQTTTQAEWAAVASFTW